MQILNLVNLENSDIKYTISRFPDGEIQITLGEFSRKNEICVKCRITNTEDLFILTQVSDILVRHGVYFKIDIYYLMGMRMDRVMDFNRPFTLKVISNILNSIGVGEINIFASHSEMTYLLVDKGYELVSKSWEEFIKKLNGQRILPDEGSVDRYYYGNVPEDVIICNKVRDIATGKITSIEIKNPEAINGNSFIIRDDLCDGGGTFIGLAETIRKIKPDAELYIVIDHMVNQKGLENISKTFNHVYITNSYKDWKQYYTDNNLIFPKNVTQFNII